MKHLHCTGWWDCGMEWWEVDGGGFYSTLLGLLKFNEDLGPGKQCELEIRS